MIELDNIHLTYPGHPAPVHALRGIALRVPAGEIFGVIGRSGAGKSSLIRVVNLLNRPTQGQVRVNGADLTALSQTELRSARHQIGAYSTPWRTRFHADGGQRSSVIADTVPR